ncbi:MAG: hypothetical protein IPP49_19695 [Saprospiraceae bacterium]|nr:hypothetical protein [Saprospiraceae bacterium]
MSKFLILLVAIVFTFSCKTDSKTIDQPATDQTVPAATGQPGQTDVPPTPVTVDIPAGADGKVHHYICEDKCKGGHSESAGKCPICGKALAHNQAWHNQQQNQSPQQPAQQPPGGPSVQTLPGQPTSPAQPQAATETVNIPAGADGIVHHYICSAGCKGGHSENAGKCPKCSKPLAHNQAWHNK